MKLGIIIGVIIGVVIVSVAFVTVILLTILPAFSETGTTTSPTPLIIISSSAPSTTPAVKPTTSVPPGGTTSPASAAAVNFKPSITSITGTELTSRTINAQLTNTGTADAHNVVARVEVTSGGSRIKLTEGQNVGQDFLTKEFGNLRAGATVNFEYTITVGLIDGLKILQNGATVILTVTSAEKTQTTSYDYNP